VAFGEAARIVPEKELTDYGYGAPYGTHLAGAFDLAEALLKSTSGPNRVLTVMYSPPTIHTDPMGRRMYNWPPSEEAAAETAQAAARLGVHAFIDAVIIVPDDDHVMKVIDAAEDLPFRHRLSCTPKTPDRAIDIFLTTVGWPVATET
jgi:uncharacterized protein with von Willebrand factor type A (vWA) domain